MSILSLSLMIRRVCHAPCNASTATTRVALHLRLRRTGHLWQARFHSVPLDDKHSWDALLYVERTQHGPASWPRAAMAMVERPGAFGDGAKRAAGSSTWAVSL